MEISTTTPIAPGQSSQPSATTGASLNYDSFLRLLIAQLKNQDPTKPMDSAQYVAQLATFSNVEQGIKMNAKLDTLMTSMALSQADGVIGRTIISEDGSIAGKVLAVRVISGGAVALLEDGRTLELGPGVTIT